MDFRDLNPRAEYRLKIALLDSHPGPAQAQEAKPGKRRRREWTPYESPFLYGGGKQAGRLAQLYIKRIR